MPARRCWSAGRPCCCCRERPAKSRNREASSRETAAPLPAAAASTLSTLFSIVDAVLWMWGVISNTLFCCYLVMISCSLSRCSPPCYESPCGQNVNQRIVRCGERPRSYRDLDDSVDGYIVAAGCRRCRLLAPQSRRAAGLAILPCDTQPLVGLQAPLRIVECQKPLYD